jgi:hypothetical protein
VAYRIDSSGVLDLFRYYPPDVFPRIWTQMETAVGNKPILAIDEVYRELEKKDDIAFQWLKARRTIVIDLDTTIQQRVAAARGYTPDWWTRARIAHRENLSL